MRIAKPTLTIVVLLLLGAAATAGDPSNDHVVSSARSATASNVSMEAMAASLREWLIQEIPDPLFEDEPGWGRTAPAATGVKWKGKGLQGHPEIVRQDKNQGTWRKIRVSTINLPSSMVLDVRNVQKVDKGRTQFDVLMAFDVRVNATQQNWSKGLKLYDGSLRARLRIKISLRCEVTARVESKEALLPDMRLRVSQADANYDHFVTEHIAGLGGDAARILGDTLQKTLRHSLEKKVLAKADWAIVKAADTKDIRLSLASILK